MVGGPYIADRRKARNHGVDVWIRLRQGGRFRVLFLQYKVPELVLTPTLDPGCSALYGDQSFFRFKLHKDAKDARPAHPTSIDSKTTSWRSVAVLAMPPSTARPRSTPTASCITRSTAGRS